MKTSVFDFIESNTLRQHLSGQVLEPAIECILISHCCTCTINDKLEALQERYDTYSADDFKKGIYNSDANDFKRTLKEYIEFKQGLLKNIYDTTLSVEILSVFELFGDDITVEGTICLNLDKTIEIAKQMLDEESYCTIIKKRCDYVDNERIIIKLNSQKEIFDVSTFKHDIAECNLQNAYALIPHKYKIGDIIKCSNIYAVVSDVKRYRMLPENFKSRSDSDMTLYCMSYKKDIKHSLGGSFSCYRFPILSIEICSESDFIDIPKPLIAYSKTLKGEYKFADFIEMYSNGQIEDLLKWR
mgnify:CR=1 FL=1